MVSEKSENECRRWNGVAKSGMPYMSRCCRSFLSRGTEINPIDGTIYYFVKC
jgi:hypothetical protein